MSDPSIRSLRARVGAYALHAQRDPRETTAKARETFLAQFIDKVDPDRSLPEAERLRRAEAARKEHFARMALHSAQARTAKAARKRAKAPGGTLPEREGPPTGASR